MKKFLVMAAFLAGPMLFAQQKPEDANQLKKAEIIKAEQSKTTNATQLNSLSDLQVENKKTNAEKAKAEAKATRRSNSAETLRDADID